MIFSECKECEFKKPGCNQDCEKYKAYLLFLNSLKNENTENKEKR